MTQHNTISQMETECLPSESSCDKTMTDYRDNQGLIPVRVFKPFDALRTPCPPAGTPGEIYAFDGKFACVRFPLPMVDTEGYTWYSHGDDDDFMRLKFKLNEIEVVDPPAS